MHYIERAVQLLFVKNNRDMTTIPSAPPCVVEPLPPPTYDEAVRNVSSEQIHLDTSNIQNSTEAPLLDEFSKKKEEKEANKKESLNNAQPPIVTQPQPAFTGQPSNPQYGPTYNFPPPNPQVQQSNDCVVCCCYCNPEDIADICNCIFCCSRHVTGHNCVCCDCGDDCCSCPDGCCECGEDCNCGDCDCDCGDCDCDCGDCDCDCNCGDCTII